MARQQVSKSLSLEQRMQVFLALVAAQDSRMTVPESKKAIADQFGLNDEQHKRIEQEGLDCQWPPLAE